MSALVVLDPGHGGGDPGAGHRGLKEADITLKISRRTKRALKRDFDVRVQMTRTDDRFVELTDRAKFANDRGAEYFVSIHINSGGGTGYEDFVHPSVAPNSKTARRQAKVHEAVAAFMAAKGIRDRGKKRDNLAVLRHTTMPAILTETLFIDTEEDARLLRTSSFLTGVAEAHAKGIAAALGLPRKS